MGLDTLNSIGTPGFLVIERKMPWRFLTCLYTGVVVVSVVVMDNVSPDVARMGDVGLGEGNAERNDCACDD
jgi:hypothetical protein